MSEIYIALVDTPGLFASIIRKCIKQDYIHVVLSLDAELEQAYSVGRRNPAVPFFAGFTRENADEILGKYPHARYRVVALECTEKQKHEIRHILTGCYKNRFSYHYSILGLPFVLFGKPFETRHHFTCSSFAAKVLDEAGVHSFDKHYSVVTPADFSHLGKTRLVYEGLLRDYASTPAPRIAASPARTCATIPAQAVA